MVRFPYANERLLWECGCAAVIGSDGKYRLFHARNIGRSSMKKRTPPTEAFARDQPEEVSHRGRSDGNDLPRAHL
jgi:hypothetical protein